MLLCVLYNSKELTFPWLRFFGIKESICIRSNTPTMNRDEEAYQLSPTWTQVISTPKPGGGGRGRLQSDFARLSQ